MSKDNNAVEVRLFNKSGAIHTVFALGKETIWSPQTILSFFPEEAEKLSKYSYFVREEDLRSSGDSSSLLLQKNKEIEELKKQLAEANKGSAIKIENSTIAVAPVADKKGK